MNTSATVSEARSGKKGRVGTSIAMKLTEAAVARAAPLLVDGVAQKRLLLDVKQIGFGVAVNAGGSKSYFVLRRVAGKQVRYKFKNVGECTVEAARREAAGLLGQMSGGGNLVAARPGTEGPIPAGRIPVEELLRESDIVSLHCPLTPQTRNLINQKTLALMKPTAFLINTARGSLVDEGALIHALRGNRLAGAALDVISREPPPPDHPVIRAGRELKNLIITPHTAWSAREARERLLSEVAENIECFFLGTPRNVVA